MRHIEAVGILASLAVLGSVRHHTDGHLAYVPGAFGIGHARQTVIEVRGKNRRGKNLPRGLHVDLHRCTLDGNAFFIHDASADGVRRFGGIVYGSARILREPRHHKDAQRGDADDSNDRTRPCVHGRATVEMMPCASSSVYSFLADGSVVNAHNGRAIAIMTFARGPVPHAFTDWQPDLLFGPRPEGPG